MKSHYASTDSLFYAAPGTDAVAMACHEHLLPIMGTAALGGSFSPLHSGALCGAPGLRHTPRIAIL